MIKLKLYLFSFLALWFLEDVWKDSNLVTSTVVTAFSLDDLFSCFISVTLEGTTYWSVQLWGDIRSLRVEITERWILAPHSCNCESGPAMQGCMLPALQTGLDAEERSNKSPVFKSLTA